MQANPSTDDSFLVVTCFRTRVMLASFLRVVKHAMERKGIENITELTKEVARKRISFRLGARRGKGT